MDNLISRNLSKLLEEGRIIRVNREVLLQMLVGMMLPGRSTVPVHFGLLSS